jgi:hypothetical protein
MDTLKMKIKTGEHEFEADGPPDAVHAGLATFARIIGAEEKADEKEVAPVPAAAVPEAPAIGKIARINGGVVSLKVAPESSQSAVLLLLLGQQQLRNNIAVAGAQIMDGLRASGKTVGRSDTILKRHAAAGFVVTTGKRKRRRYRLTKDGVEKAQAIASALAGSLPQEKQ